MLRNISQARLEGEDDSNFFVAIGFHKPHLPFVFPERFMDYYPEVSTPPNNYAPWRMPRIAWQSYGETRSYKDIAALHASGAINTTLPDGVVKDLRRAYYAAVSYTDYNVGQVLSTLKEVGLDQSTVVVFWGDHGWQLGEHGEWDKHTNFNLATHAPVMYRVPGLTDRGRGVRTYQVVETVDIFPSLVDFAMGSTIPLCADSPIGTDTCTDGVSARPLIAQPDEPVKAAAYSVYDRGIPHVEVHSPSPSRCLLRDCAMGYTMLTWLDGHQLRYTEWVHFLGPEGNWLPDWSTNYGTELYNHTSDPGENNNIFADHRGSQLTQRLSERLRVYV